MKALGSAVNYSLKPKKVAIQSTVGPYKQLIHAAAVVKANTLPFTAPSITPSQKKKNYTNFVGFCREKMDSFGDLRSQLGCLKYIINK